MEDNQSTAKAVEPTVFSLLVVGNDYYIEPSLRGPQSHAKVPVRVREAWLAVPFELGC